MLSEKSSINTDTLITPDSTTIGNYWGLDTMVYPGAAKMQDWWTNSPCYFTGYYLAPAPDRTDASWMGTRATLATQGWGFIPLFLGRQNGWSNLTSAQGAADANSAISLMLKEGFPSGFPNQTYVYLDIESGPPLSSQFISYVQGWVNQIMSDGRFLPGIYCSYLLADTIKNAINNSSVRFYVFHLTYSASQCYSGTAPDPSASGVSYATTWQLCQNISKTFGSSTINPVDVDASIYQNPSDSVVSI